jgi:hypothetical protein
MGAPDLRVEVYHLISFLLSFCTHHWERASTQPAVRALLREVLLLTGHFCLQTPSHQHILRWGKSPTILQKLCSVPFAYFWCAAPPGRSRLNSREPRVGSV